MTYDQGATSIPLTGVTVVSATQITGTLVIPDFAPTGSYSVTVTNADGGTVTRASTFTVNSNTPTVSSIAPTSGNRGWPVSITNLKGTNFQPGATVNLNRAGYADIRGYRGNGCIIDADYLHFRSAWETIGVMEHYRDKS